MKDQINPWLTIPASDYEGHMSLPEVAQAQALNSMMHSALQMYTPESLAVVGCATGNGFEHIDTSITQRVVAIDINFKYLSILSDRFSQTIPSLELMNVDISTPEFTTEPVAAVFAALVFEYVDVQSSLLNIKKSLTENGVFVAVLQEPNSKVASVTPTPYESLKRLSPIMNLVESKKFSNLCERLGFMEINQAQEHLKSGKKFWVGTYRNVPVME